ncbi:MAG: hypothetical protein SOZ00_03155 [Tidjanibacter sp.]|nr:hypothetical protein [Tidjanibacter sp.]
MRIFIDNSEVDTDSRTVVEISFSMKAATSLEWNREVIVRSVRIPATRHNCLVMGDAAEVHSATLYNSVDHRVEITHDGSAVARGKLFLRECAVGCHGYYLFDLLGEGNDWVVSALGKIGSLPIDYSTEISASAVLQSWTSTDKRVRFLPVDRYPSSETTIPAVRHLSSSDYHPFLHIATMVKALFEQSGYVLQSDFVETPEFDSLYMSGRYRERDASAMIAKMDFLAGRFADSATAVADSSGRVSASPTAAYSTIGNLVDTADPNETDSAGNRIAGVFTQNGCFTKSDGAICFVPTGSVSVGFCYHIIYRTDYRILSRARLKGFDTIGLHSGDVHLSAIANRFVDRRNELLYGRTYYRVVVFDHTEGAEYRLTAMVVGTTQNVELKLFATRSALFNRTTLQTLGSPVLQILYGDTYFDYDGDWAIYDGAVGETGSCEVDITLREAPAAISPSSPKRFDTIWFGGADEGMSLCLKAATRVRPVFVPHPTDGSTVGFADLAAGLPSQLTLLQAVAQMYNLVFLTDNLEHTVRIVKREQLFVGGEKCSLDGRIDRSQPIVIEELGADKSRTITLGYAHGDATVDTLNRTTDNPMGDWSFETDNLYAAKSTQRIENPLFTPTLSASGVMGNAMSALLLAAGDRSTHPFEAKADNLNFATKVVRYVGMQPLLEGEQWSWPSNGSEYPLAAFHLPSATGVAPFTLCYEDRDSLSGLHTAYREQLAELNSSRRLTLQMILYADEVEQLLMADASIASARRIYTFNLGGEEVRCRLEEIVGFNPLKQTAKCKFITIATL